MGRGVGSAPQPNPLLFPPTPKKLIMEKLMEEDAFRKELAQSAVKRCQRKQPLGSRRELEPLPDGAPEPREEDGGSSWGEGSLLGQEEVEDESDELEEPAAGPDTAVPKFEGKGSVCLVPRVQRETALSGGTGGHMHLLGVSGAVFTALGALV